MNIKKTYNDVPKAGIFFNLIVVVLSIIFKSSSFLYLTIIVNILLFGSMIIIHKFGFMIDAISQTNKLMKGLTR